MTVIYADMFYVQWNHVMWNLHVCDKQLNPMQLHHDTLYTGVDVTYFDLADQMQIYNLLLQLPIDRNPIIPSFRCTCILPLLLSSLLLHHRSSLHFNDAKIYTQTNVRGATDADANGVVKCIVNSTRQTHATACCRAKCIDEDCNPWCVIWPTMCVQIATYCFGLFANWLASN